jgi:hypothetical protein
MADPPHCTFNKILLYWSRPLMRRKRVLMFRNAIPERSLKDIFTRWRGAAALRY